MEAHNPFRPPEAFREHAPLDVDGWKYELGEQSLSGSELDILKSLYKGEIEYLDGVVRRLHESLSDDNTIFVVTSDHGVSLGEHGKLYHGSCLYETTVHVPLLINGVDRDEDVEQPVGIIGLYQTLLDLAEIDVPPHARGTNVLEPTSECILAEMHGTDDWLEKHAREHHGEKKARMVSATRRSFICSDEKLIRNEDTGETELYELSADPNERDTLIDSSRTHKMEQRLDATINKFEIRKNKAEQESVDKEMKQNLRDLGYLK
jgi:arylsulfatase A-like enzyme